MPDDAIRPEDDAENAGGQGDGIDGEWSRSDRRLVERAVRQDWPIPADVQRKVVKRLVRYLDLSTLEGAQAKPAAVIGAARAIAGFGALALRQQAIDLDRQKFEGKARDVTLAELVAAAEARAAERKRERGGGG